MEKETYRQVAAGLVQLGRLHAEHQAMGDCTKGPVCPGVHARDVLIAALERDRDPAGLLLAAIGEIGRLDAEVNQLHGRLAEVSEQLADWEQCAALLGPIGEVRGD